MEFMSLRVPVVVPRTKVDRYYFDDSVVRFFEPGNSEALAEAMIELLTDDDLRQKMVARASEYVARNQWEPRKADYLRLVDSLCPAN
jgi:glycosyltransferase involved in cell wall biosynthesis